MFPPNFTCSLLQVCVSSVLKISPYGCVTFGGWKCHRAAACPSFCSSKCFLCIKRLLFRNQFVFGGLSCRVVERAEAERGASSLHWQCVSYFSSETQTLFLGLQLTFVWESLLQSRAAFTKVCDGGFVLGFFGLFIFDRVRLPGLLLFAFFPVFCSRTLRVVSFWSDKWSDLSAQRWETFRWAIKHL